MIRTLIPVSLTLLLAGCATHASITPAHTVGQGNFEGAVEPGVAIAPTGVGTATVPTLNIAGRYGVSDKFDLGGRIGSVSYELTAKYMFTEAEGTVVSLAPTTTFWFLSVGGAGGGFYTLQTPVLIGLPVGEHQLVVGPNWFLTSFFGGADGVNAGALIMGPGAQLGFSAKLGDSFRLHPELAMKWPVIGAVSASGVGGASGATGASPFFGFNVGLLFGGR